MTLLIIRLPTTTLQLVILTHIETIIGLRLYLDSKKRYVSLHMFNFVAMFQQLHIHTNSISSFLESITHYLRIKVHISAIQFRTLAKFDQNNTSNVAKMMSNKAAALHLILYFCNCSFWHINRREPCSNTPYNIKQLTESSYLKNRPTIFR